MKGSLGCQVGFGLGASCCLVPFRWLRLRRGWRFQSSIRSRVADQCVVRFPGAQSKPAAVGLKGLRSRPDTGASSPWVAPRARVSASRWTGWWSHAASANSSVTSSGCSVQAADLAVSEAVVAKGKDLTGDGDFGDLGAAAFGDALILRSQRATADRDLLSGFGERPAQDRGALMGMCPSRALPSELRTVGVSPAHAHRCRAVGNRCTSPISAITSIAV